jgi:hypothetical protein
MIIPVSSLKVHAMQISQSTGRAGKILLLVPPFFYDLDHLIIRNIVPIHVDLGHGVEKLRNFQNDGFIRDLVDLEANLHATSGNG